MPPRPIRSAAAADVAAVARLTEAAYAGHAAVIGRRPAPMDADHAAAVAAGRVWVVDGDDGRPVAALVLVDGGDHLLVESVAVDPAAQGSGIGARLMAHAENEARAAGHGEVRLYTNARMAANLRWYPALGWGVEDGFARVFYRKRIGP